MNHHLATKHAVWISEAKTKSLTSEKSFGSFYSLQNHKKSEKGKLAQNQDRTVNLEPIVRDYHDKELCGEPIACQYFLVDSEFDRGRRHCLNFALTDITLSFLNYKLQHVFENVHCAVKKIFPLDLIFAT